VGLEASASPLLNASQELIVTLADEGGRPIDGADVYLDLTMPAMPMGTNRPVAEPLGEGRYRARTAYTMSGEWEITVVAEIAGAEHRALFTRSVSE
jgi:nitrogen fixation protein FixH